MPVFCSSVPQAVPSGFLPDKIQSAMRSVSADTANIKIYAGMLEKHMADAEGTAYLDVLRQQTDKLDFLIYCSGSSGKNQRQNRQHRFQVFIYLRLAAG